MQSPLNSATNCTTQELNFTFLDYHPNNNICVYTYIHDVTCEYACVLVFVVQIKLFKLQNNLRNSVIISFVTLEYIIL